MSKPIYCRYCLKLITNAERKTRFFCDRNCNQRFKRARAANKEWITEQFDTLSKFEQIRSLAAQNIIARIGLMYGADAARAAIDIALITQLDHSANDAINQDGIARDDIAKRYPNYLG